MPRIFQSTSAGAVGRPVAGADAVSFGTKATGSIERAAGGAGAIGTASSPQATVGLTKQIMATAAHARRRV
jgi:hypothetical protein